MVSRAGALRPLTMFRGCRGRRDDVPAASFHLGATPSHLSQPRPPFSLSEVEGHVPTGADKQMEDGESRGLRLRRITPKFILSGWLASQPKGSG